LFRIVCFFCLAAIAASCKKDHRILGQDVQPNGDAYHTTYSDTSTIYAYTIKVDSTGASKNTATKFLGSNQDPVFGRMDVGLYLNPNMNLNNLNFGSDAAILSSEIILAVDNINFIGDPNAQLTFSVFAMDSVLDATRLVYYTNNTKLYSHKDFICSVTTSFSTINGQPVIRIPIDNVYANAVLNNPGFLVDNTTFQSTYKGFYITAAGSNLSTTQGIIYACNLENSVSGFYLYYRNGNPSATKTDKSFQFTFSGPQAMRFNTVKYSPQQGGVSNLLQQVISKDTTAGSQNLYLAGMGATKLKLHIPYLKNYTDSFRISVDRAELVLNVDPAFATSINSSIQYSVAPELVILPIDSLGRESFSLDQTDEARYGGIWDPDNNNYVFNIARYVQRIMNGSSKNLGFYVVIGAPLSIYANVYYPPSTELVILPRDDNSKRVVLAGTGNPGLKPKLNLSYVKLKVK